MTAGPVAPAAAPSAPATTAVVEAHALGRVFAGRRAVDGVSFSLGAGECLALFGPNGAGKTTLLRMLGGLLRPTSGRATLGGVALPGGAALRARVGLVSHQSLLYAALTARENVEFAAKLYGVRDPAGATRAALARMRVLDRAESPVRALSRGLQQRVSIARATVHAPGVVLLDEPYTGLDEAGAGALSALLSQLLADGASLVLVTHNLAEGLAVATHAAVMRDGRFARFDRRASIDAPAYAAEYRALTGAGVRHAARPRD
jgi:heme exporter protein A